MNRSQFLACVVGLSVLTTAAMPAAAESSWKMPNLNPFSKSTAPKAPAKKSTSLFKAPSWNLFGQDQAKRSRPPQPSTWDKLSSGTKNFYEKTKQTLNPWDDPPKKSSSTASRRPAPKKQSSSSFFSSWFKPQEEPTRPKTVSEFLAQPRP